LNGKSAQFRRMVYNVMNVNDIKMYNSWQCHKARLVKVPVLVADPLTDSNHTSHDA